MTVFFDISKLEQAAGVDAQKFIALFKLHFTKELPSKRSKYKPINLSGKSFLLNPKQLLLANVLGNFKVQYIKLAARRDYSTYKLLKQTGLDLTLFPDVGLDLIKHNPLLTILDQQVHFKFEE